MSTTSGSGGPQMPEAEGQGDAPPAAADGLADALGHLQAAALSMVAAARAAVDAAEELVRDPKPLLDILAAAARAGWEPPDTPADAPPRPRVEHITVRSDRLDGSGEDEAGHEGAGPGR